MTPGRRLRRSGLDPTCGSPTTCRCGARARRRGRRTASRSPASSSTSRPTTGCGCPTTTPPRCGSPACRAATGPGRWAAPTGQQAVYDGQLVREEQPDFAGHLQDGGHLEIRCRMTISPRSMAALWLCGFEKQPDHCGEICVTEVFGKDVVPGRVRRGRCRPQADPRPEPRAGLRRPPAADRRRRISTPTPSTGTQHEAVFTVDGEEVRRCAEPADVPAAADGGGLRLPGGARARQHLVQLARQDQRASPEGMSRRTGGRSGGGRICPRPRPDRTP